MTLVEKERSKKVRLLLNDKDVNNLMMRYMSYDVPDCEIHGDGEIHQIIEYFVSDVDLDRINKEDYENHEWLEGVNEISITTGPSFTRLVHARRQDNGTLEINKEVIIPNSAVIEIQTRKSLPKQREISKLLLKKSR